MARNNGRVPLLDPSVAEVFRVADLTGVIGNAVLGGLLARGARFDLIGFASLAIVAGLGGGILRDTLLQDGPPVALTEYPYLLTALVGAFVAYSLPVEGHLWNRLFPVADAVAVGAWAAAGALKTLALGLGWLPAVLLGTITAVGGSVIRDLLLQRRPAIFQAGNTLYATSALVASGVMVGFHHAAEPEIGLVLATLVGAGLTLVASWRGWTLPEPSLWHAGARHGRFPRPAWRIRKAGARN